MSEPEAVVERAVERLRPLYKAASLSWWDANVSATEENEQRRVAAELALSDALADADLFGDIEAARANGAEPLVRRQLDLLHASLVPQQVPESLRHRIVELEASVESRFAQHRGEVAGRPVDDNEIKRILRESDDVAERREAWEASKTVGAAVADDVRELARLRNEAARSLGYRDWFALAVDTSEMDETRLFETLDECDRLTADAFAGWKAATDARLAERFGCAVGELRPWHYEDPFFQEVPAAGGVDLTDVFAGKDVVALARATYDGLGVDTNAILDRSDLFPRDGKCQHAFCIDVDREGDVRVLANVADDRYWADTMLHELGHGAYDIGFDQGAAVAPARLPPHRHRGHRDPDGPPRAGRRVAPRGGRARLGGRRAARGGPSRGAGRGAARLHALGARDDELRARALRRPRGRPRTPSGGSSCRATSS